MTATSFPFIVGAYLLGSVPSAYLMLRWLRGTDIRQVGSAHSLAIKLLGALVEDQRVGNLLVRYPRATRISTSLSH